MTREEMDAALGRTKREYREARAEFRAVRKRHADFSSELRKFLLAMEQEPRGVYAVSNLQGSLQTSMDFPGAKYLFRASLSDRLSMNAAAAHFDEYRGVFERVESLRKSLVEQGDDDPGPVE